MSNSIPGVMNEYNKRPIRGATMEVHTEASSRENYVVAFWCKHHKKWEPVEGSKGVLYIQESKVCLEAMELWRKPRCHRRDGVGFDTKQEVYDYLCEELVPHTVPDYIDRGQSVYDIL